MISPARFAGPAAALASSSVASTCFICAARSSVAWNSRRYASSDAQVFLCLLRATSSIAKRLG